MNQSVKRGLALFMAIVMCISLLPALHLDADAASYVYNWGVRGVTAEELSASAENFYVAEGYSYDQLAALSGGTGKSDAYSSQLYQTLYTLMSEAQDHITSYNETRSMYAYTDCENGGGSISSFYSGAAIGPAWDSGSTWNREHVWPNSKSNSGSNSDTTRECDIMMLRPASVSENSSRGNKAYGEGSAYYNPNGESNGTYDLRGDVARIVLYVYVRWGGDSQNHDGAWDYMWGSTGVIESPEILLKWIEEDPVDTWELGRNDSVQSITGTRNVFVDYPELAFLLFGQEVPVMTTPSGEAEGGCGHNNYDAGTKIEATCTTIGYTLYTCQTPECGYSYKGEKEAALNHNFVNGVCTRTGCGAEEDSLASQIEAANKLANGEYLAAVSTITGTITDTPTASSYTAGSYKFTVSDGTHTLLCYYVPVTGGTPKMGDTVTVTGSLTAYNGAAQFDDTATATIIESGDSGDDNDQPGGTTPEPGIPGDSRAPVHGEQVVIYNPASGKALSTTKTGNYNVGVDVTFNDGVLTGYGDTEIFTVIVNSDGTYTFVNNGQNLGVNDGFTSMGMGVTQDKWELTDRNDGTFLIKNTDSGTYMEWYTKYSNWSTYETASDAQFYQCFYIVEAEEEEVPDVIPGTGKYTMIDKIADLTEGTYLVSGYLTNFTSNGTPYDWSANPYHVWDGTTDGGDLVTGLYSFSDGVLTYASGNKGVAVELIAVEGKANTYYVKVGNQYLYSSEAGTNRKLGLTDDATEWVASDHTSGGIVLSSNGVNLGTAGAVSKLLRSYKDASAASSLKYGLVFFADATAGCEHDYDEGVTTDATCTAGGYITYTCSKCGGYYTGNYTGANGHKNTTDEPQQDATKAESGFTAGTYCEDCKTWIAGHTVIPALGFDVYLIAPDSVTKHNSLNVLPLASAEGYQFVGWVASAVKTNTETAPTTIYKANTNIHDDLTEDIVLYALFSKTESVGGGSVETTTEYIKVTSADDFTTGEYVMVVNSSYAPDIFIDGWITAASVTISGDKVTNTKNAVWTLTVSGDKVTLKDRNGTFVKPKSGNSNGIQTGSYSWAWACSSGTFTFKGTGSDTTILALNKQEGKLRAYKTTTVSGNATGYPSTFTLYKLTEVTTGDPGTTTTYYTTFTTGMTCAHETVSLKDRVPATAFVDGKEVELYCSVCESGIWGGEAIDSFVDVEEGVELPEEFLDNSILLDEEFQPDFGANDVDELKLVITEYANGKIVFDVTPMNGDEEAVLTEAITFYLPVFADDMAFAKLYHEGEYVTTLEILGEDGNHYVVITAIEFSEYALVPAADDATVVVIGEREFESLQAAVNAAEEGDTIVLLADVTAGAVNATGLTIDLNGHKLTADIAGTIKMNGGTFATSDYVMVGENGKYTSADGIFTIAANATFDMTFHSGTVSLNETLWYTLEGQTLTVEEDATFVIPAGKTLYINGSIINIEGAVENHGTLLVRNGAQINGIVTLHAADATVEGPEGLNVVTLLDEHKVVYEDGFYKSVQKVYVAKIGDVRYESLQEAFDAANTGDVIVLLKDVELSQYLDVYTQNAGETARTITLMLNGYTVSPASDYRYSDYPLVYVGLNQTLNIVGEGKITAAKNVTIGVYGVLNIKGGTVENTGETENDIAVHIYHWEGGNGYEGEAVGSGSISGGTIVGGNFAVYNEGGLEITGGEFVGNITNDEELNGSLEISGGSFTVDVSDYCVDGFVIVDNGDGTFGVAVDHVHKAGEWVVMKQPTCSERGLRAAACSCGLTYYEWIEATGNHEFGKWNLTKEATCTVAGIETRKCACGASETRKTELAAHTEVVDAAVAPTCTEKGLSEGKHCSVCNAVLVAQQEVAAAGHKAAVDAAVAPTCTAAGLTEGKHCSVCDVILVVQTAVPALGHTEVVDAAVAPTCTEKGKTEGRHCSVCNAVLVAQYELAANGHYFGAWSVTKEATRQEAGQQVRSCSCGATETTEIPAIEGVNPIVIVVAVVAGLGVAAAAAFIFLKRK